MNWVKLFLCTFFEGLDLLFRWFVKEFDSFINLFDCIIYFIDCERGQQIYLIKHLTCFNCMSKSWIWWFRSFLLLFLFDDFFRDFFFLS
jgi:hypothetical protein